MSSLLRRCGLALAVVLSAGCEREPELVPEAPTAPAPASVTVVTDLAVGASTADGKPPLLGSDPYGLLSKKVPSAEAPRERIDPSKLDPSALMASAAKPAAEKTPADLARDPRAEARSQLEDAQSSKSASDVRIMSVTADSVATRVIRGSGRPHVLLFYAAYCAACREAMPGFVAAARAYVARNVGFTLASVDSDLKRFSGYAPVLAGAFEALWIVPDVPGSKAQALKRMGVTLTGESFGIPYLTVFDRNRKVVSQGHGEAMASIGPTLDVLLAR